MSDGMKISLQNALTIVGLIIACVATYMGTSAKVDAQTVLIEAEKERNDKQDVLLLKMTDIQHRQDLDIQRNADMYTNILENQRDIRDFIKELEVVD